jgi:hypothetical protein
MEPMTAAEFVQWTALIRVIEPAEAEEAERQRGSG